MKLIFVLLGIACAASAYSFGHGNTREAPTIDHLIKVHRALKVPGTKKMEYGFDWPEYTEDEVKKMVKDDEKRKERKRHEDIMKREREHRERERHHRYEDDGERDYYGGEEDMHFGEDEGRYEHDGPRHGPMPFY